jgi:hypothetical protein
LTEDELRNKLTVQPAFQYKLYNIDKHLFFGKYPLWDLYAFHSMLLKTNVLQPYFMSLHMEEFLDVDYVEKVIGVLDQNGFDLMFGNLSRTTVTYGDVKPILDTGSSREFDRYLTTTGLKNSVHWAFDYKPLFRSRNINFLKRNARKLADFRFRKRLRPTRSGYTRLRDYIAEDVYFMKRDFANRYNWFLQGHHLYFEDIHVCEQKGVCELSKELAARTQYPVYFNLSKVYHIEHEKYYFQMVDDEFTKGLINFPSDDPLLNTHKKAITMYREGKMTLKEALTYTRKNAEGTGTQNLNYQYHMKYLNPGESSDPQRPQVLQNEQTVAGLTSTTT